MNKTEPTKFDIKKALEDFGSKYSYWLTSSGSGESEAYHNKCDAEDPILTYVTNLERERDELKPKEGYYKPSRKGRRQGNTTRRADEIIQSLFDGKWVALWDHHHEGSENMGEKRNAHIADLIKSRLFREHKLRPEHFKVYGEYELELLPEYVASYKTAPPTDSINKSKDKP